MPYGIEETYENFQQEIYKNLLDPAVPIVINDKKRKKNLRVLINSLEILNQESSDNPLFSNIISKIDKLLNLLKNLLTIYENYKSRSRELGSIDQGVIKDINKELTLIIETIVRWLENVRRKSEEVAVGNKHLKDIKLHPINTRFYTKIKEFNPDYTEEMVHPINKQQKQIQRKRTTEELLKLDKKDPITGARNYRIGDDYSFPGSKLIVSQGHHRLYELYMRYLQGMVDGNMLVEFIIDEKCLKKR